MSRTCAAVLALSVSALLGLMPRWVRATTFVLMDERSLLESSHAVLIGTVTAIESAVPEPNGPIYTYVHVQPQRIIKGRLRKEPVVLREPGGSIDARHEWIYGAPEFWVGERALLFLSRNPDGTLQTNSLSMGKYTLGVDASGRTTAVRNFGNGTTVMAPEDGALMQAPLQTQRLLPLLSRLRTLAGAESPTAPSPSLTLTPPELGTTTTEYHDSFTFLSNPSVRWFEPDRGQPVSYFVDSVGDTTLGFATSRAAFDSALAAWTNVATSSLVLEDAGTTGPIRLNDCSNTTSRVIFNDPFGEVPDPSNCGGVLAMGGYCSTGNTTMVNGMQFLQIVTGRVTVNNGWGSCSFWNQCNVAEVLTHELGHTLGLGHASEASPEPNATLADATMYFRAHLDGRCAAVRSDDIAGISFLYPQNGTPKVTPTATRAGTLPPAQTVSPTRTATMTPTTGITPMSTSTPTGAPQYTVGGQIRYAGSGLPVDGVTVQLRGPEPASAQTDSTGQFTFSGLPAATWRIVPQKFGGSNNSVSASDAVAVLQAAVGARSPDVAQQLACDVNGDGRLSAADALLVLQYKVGSITSFPASQQCGSDWVFVPQPAPVANLQALPPVLAAGSCQPGEICWAPLTSQANDQDFTAAFFGDCSGNWQPEALRLAHDANYDTAAVRIGTVRTERQRSNLHGSRLRIPLSVDSSTAVRALDVRLRYDPRRMTPVGVQRRHGARHALVAMNAAQPGTLVLSLASSEPLQRGTVLMLQFERRGGDAHPTVDIVTAMASSD